MRSTCKSFIFQWTSSLLNHSLTTQSRTWRCLTMQIHKWRDWCTLSLVLNFVLSSTNTCCWVQLKQTWVYYCVAQLTHKHIGTNNCALYKPQIDTYIACRKHTKWDGLLLLWALQLCLRVYTYQRRQSFSFSFFSWLLFRLSLTCSHIDVVVAIIESAAPTTATPQQVVSRVLSLLLVQVNCYAINKQTNNSKWK